PADAMMVTRLDNLSIYIMDSSHRRHIEENAKRDRIENYESLKVDFVVEDYGCACLIENIKVGTFKASAAPEQASAPVDDNPADDNAKE
ncbi:P2 family phage major capsid protein, partial [Hafnia alvei]|uniref:P2 family phage major capsid protein n=1 Tax=Hafnia alvei TaxID=569 RepID=UPI0010DBFB3E